ncbi:hypothetical protein BB560_000622 [Smittium megazygosporum]|uniref:Uncharacterized protein n=1 Tax=Smittium megazygosporum TaxID=133381 RepID=A0A2T9ZJY1_9FUNG|nr:hypothetical protein BB560_000622 [Smittium megazygosporum]
MTNNVFIWNCRFPWLSSNLRVKLQKYATYTSGALFAIGWWLFIDGLIVARHTVDFGVNIGLEDWVPGLLATFGMLITNSIDLSSLNDESDFEYGSSRIANRVKLMLFIGIALIAGGVAGSFAILVIKYTNAGEPGKEALYTGITGVAQTLLILTR